METPVSDLDRSISRENTEAEPRFFELINFTRNLMLRDPELHLPNRSADDSSDTSIHFLPDTERDELPSPFVSLEANPKVLREIEALGKALLEEAFLCLGEDAVEKADLLAKNYHKEEEALAIVNWLLYRIENIEDVSAHDYKGEEDEAITHDYQPFRISPKVIGEYPTIRVNPTCLGKAILTSSFFYKAGLPVVQASVVRTRSQELTLAQTGLAHMFIKAADPAHVETLPLFTTIKETQKKMLTHNGFHAATYVKFPSRWLQLDPNYGQNTLASKYESGYFTNAFKAIRKNGKGTQYFFCQYNRS